MALPAGTCLDPMKPWHRSAPAGWAKCTRHAIRASAAMLLKGSKKDVPTIARELSVRYVLEGSVRRAGNSLRIAADAVSIDPLLWFCQWSRAWVALLDGDFAAA
jgi:hypothetical protein